MKGRPYIAVVGGSEPSRTAEAIAEQIGSALARRGAVIVCGGLGGIMAAVCRGAHEEGGTTVGILPTEQRADGNDHLDIALATGLGEIRNTLIVRSADAVIAIEGEFGTLSEIGFALRIGKPVVGIDTWEVAQRGQASDAIVRVSSAAEAVEKALELVPRG